MNWRVVVAVVLALVVGAGAGALAEHERLKNKSDKKTSTTVKHTATTPTTLPSDFFGAKKTAACPTLKAWEAAVGKATYETASGHPWLVSRVELVKQNAATTTTYQTMFSQATPAGKVELEYLIANAVQLRNALAKAPSAADYATSNKALTSARAKHDVGVLVKAVASCK